VIIIREAQKQETLSSLQKCQKKQSLFLKSLTAPSECWPK